MNRTLKELMGEYEHCLDTVQERRKRAAFQYRVTRDPDDGRRRALLEEMESDLLYSLGMLSRDCRK